MVAAIISAMVKDDRFKSAIKTKIGNAVDTSEMEERIEALRAQLKQVQGTKTRLEHQMDNLDVADAHYNKKISDLQRRYDEQYDKAETIETQMDEWNSRLLSVRQEKISADNVYQLLLAFDKLYNTFTEVEQRDFMRAFIERIDIYPEKPDNGCWIRNIVFNFPMPVQGRDIKGLPLESKSTVETVCLLSKLHEAKHHINVKVDMDELDLTSAEAKATYKEIEEWVQENYGFHVTNLNIAQVKQKHGIIERENYNKPKSEDSRQPGCPEEKVKAIEDAMRHFQMI
jgi:site-specific DNA recombinase